MPSSSRNAPNARRGHANRTIGDYLIERLLDYGVKDIFGIPGDYVLSFYSMLEQSPLQVVGCTREDCAGFAADAYARLQGMGAVCVTYCVGGLSVCNSIAGAFAEKSPIVVISGAPGLNERVKGALLHHQVRDFRTQYEVFEKFTIASTELSDPLTAFAEIDRVLDACDRYKRPVYIELPRDMVNVAPPVTHAFRQKAWQPDANATQEAIDEAISRLNRAEKPLILAGVEMHRFGLQDELVQFAEETKIPIAATMLGKSVVGERHPLYVGVYEGALGRSEVTRFVEESDVILLLGAFMTDINLGVYSANLDVTRCIYATSEQLRISHHHFHDVSLPDFLTGLRMAKPRPAVRTIPQELHPVPPGSQPFTPDPERAITIQRMIQILDRKLDRQTIVIADVGDSLFAATELVIEDKGEFLSPAYYTSMGFSVPAALGASVARDQHRILVLVGDGAFQMTGQELSSIVRRGASPIIMVLDNQGYGTERYLHPGNWKYNEIQAWNYHKLPEIYGGGKGFDIRTEGEFMGALEQVWDDRSGMSLLHVHLEHDDASETLRRLAQRLGARVQGLHAS